FCSLLTSPRPTRALHSFPTRRSSDLEQSFDRFQVLLLQLDVGGNRHRAEPIMAVGNFRGFLEMLNGIRPPLRHFVELRLVGQRRDRKSTRLNSSHVSISYAVFCLKKK